MPLVPVIPLPGVCKIDSDYSQAKQYGFAGGTTVGGFIARGRYKDMNGARFIAGFPEKIGGYLQQLTSTMLGVPRGSRDWRDLSSNVRDAIGTHLKLYYYSTFNTTFTDITPLRGTVTGTLGNNPITTNGTTTVEVAHTGHGLVTGDYVMLSGATAVDGVTANGVWNPITVVDANDYTFVYPVAATGSTSGGGNAITYVYYRKTLSGNPFSVTDLSAIVTITDNAHGAITNDFVTISGASAVGGITLSGNYQITVVDANTYTVVGPNVASSTTTGGGSPEMQYEINTGVSDQSLASGYGEGGYGEGTYGFGTSSTVQPRTWSLWAYGQQILANPSGGGLYVFDPSIGSSMPRAYPVYNAPTTMLAMFLTLERFVFALGISGQYMEIAWPDQSDYTDWTSTAQNTANSGRQLQGGSYLVGGLPVRDGTSLIFSNTHCFTFTYTGDNEVYADSGIGDAGLIAPLAACEIDGIAYWMSPTNFLSWNGAVQPLPSDDIKDYVFTTKNSFPGINVTQSYKFWCRANKLKREVWFYYADASSNEINRYVIYHVDQQCWSIGTRAFTTGVDQSLYPTPMECDATGHIYASETGTDANGAAIDSYVTFAPTDLSNGDKMFDIFAVVPDFERLTNAGTWTNLLRNYPNDTDTVDGPYTITALGNPGRIDTNRGCQGRMAGWEFESNVIGGDWRLGIVRAEAQPAGARR